MNSMHQTVVQFLQSAGMDHLDVDFEKNVQLFLDQMTQGLAGRPGSLEMIPTYLQAGVEVPQNKPVVVADAGGTHFRVATVTFHAGGKPVIEHMKKFTMPGVERHLSRKEFFHAMAGYFHDVAACSQDIGFCFSYPAEILPSKDGRLIRFAKEIKADEVVGELIGENLGLSMAALGMPRPRKVIILNDTVATLLAGVGHENRVYDSYIGFILGTGTNSCYLESNANITKRSELDPNGEQIINVESGGMSLVHRGRYDIEFEALTKNPGVNIFEKMQSGAYLGPLMLFTLKKACEAGLFSDAAAGAVTQIDDLDTRRANEFLSYPFGENPLAAACGRGTEKDAVTAYLIVDRLTERAAKLSAINLAAAALKSGKGSNPARPICIVAEGTTFYQMKSLRSRTEFYLKKYLEDQCRIYTELVNVDNATLIGAAIAGLIN